MTLRESGRRATACAPTAPAGRPGQDRAHRLRARRVAEIDPPFDCMMLSGDARQLRLERAEVVDHQRRHIRVDDRRAPALELAIFRAARDAMPTR